MELDEPRTTNSQKRTLDEDSPDLEDLGRKVPSLTPSLGRPPLVTKHARTLTPSQQLGARESWRDVLGAPPRMGSTRVRGEREVFVTGMLLANNESLLQQLLRCQFLCFT